MSGGLDELTIFSNTFDDDDENLHQIAKAGASISISAFAFEWLNSHSLVKKYCEHIHFNDE